MPASGCPADEQTHPLHGLDRERLDGLLAMATPTDADLVDLARLLIRYEGFPGASDLQADLEKTLRLWGLSRPELNNRCRQIWAAGFRPGQVNSATETAAVGSGFDSSDGEGQA
jgi:hypothetical protein